MSSKIIIDTQTLTRTLARLAHEIIEHSEGYEEVYLVGIKRRGVPLAKMLKTNIESFSNLKVHLGELDTATVVSGQLLKMQSRQSLHSDEKNSVMQ